MNKDDALDEFRVSSPREIQAILKQLLDGSVLMALHGEDDAVYTSAIWTVDADRGTIGFNADPADPAMAALLRCDDVTVVGYLDSVKIQFEVGHLVVVNGQRASVLSCSAPRALYRFQRRNAFRVRPLARVSPMARLRHPDMPDTELALRIIDVSIGGCGLFLPAEQPTMARGTLIPDVRMELDEDTRLDMTLRLHYTTVLREPGRGARLGLEFVRPGGEALRMLQRYIDLTQKRGKLMALN